MLRTKSSLVIYRYASRNDEATISQSVNHILDHGQVFLKYLKNGYLFDISKLTRVYGLPYTLMFFILELFSENRDDR